MFKSKRHSSGSAGASGKDSPTTTSKLLPSPVTEEYIRSCFSIILRRDSIRIDQHDSLPGEDGPLQDSYRAQVGMHPYNARYNRYTDVVPYDWSRVVLPPPSGSALPPNTANSSNFGSAALGTYVNASWVRELCGGKWTVATQAPLEKSAHAFLSLLLLPVTPPQFGPELSPSAGSPTPQSSSTSSIRPPPVTNRLRTIVQLTPNVEGRLKKAFQYFPKEIGQEIIWQPETRTSHPLMDGTNPGAGVDLPHHPPISITLLDFIPSKHEEPVWIQSILQVSFVGSTEPAHLVRHLHYLEWPDHGVPADMRSLLQFMQYVDACNTDASHRDYDDNPDPPIIVGCSAGVGRTGTYIALGSLLRGHGLNRSKGPIVVEQVERFDKNIARSSRGKANWNHVGLKSSPLGPLPKEFAKDKVALEVDWLRDHRTMMVQTVDQLRFIYRTFAAAIELEEQTNGGKKPDP